VKTAAQDNYTFTSIITALVNHDVFRMQGPEENGSESQVAAVANRN
jgi:hypothetical protein